MRMQKAEADKKTGRTLAERAGSLPFAALIDLTRVKLIALEQKT